MAVMVLDRSDLFFNLGTIEQDCTTTNKNNQGMPRRSFQSSYIAEDQIEPWLGLAGCMVDKGK